MVEIYFENCRNLIVRDNAEVERMLYLNGKIYKALWNNFSILVVAFGMCYFKYSRTSIIRTGWGGYFDTKKY